MTISPSHVFWIFFSFQSHLKCFEIRYGVKLTAVKCHQKRERFLSLRLFSLISQVQLQYRWLKYGQSIVIRIFGVLTLTWPTKDITSSLRSTSSVPDGVAVKRSINKLFPDSFYLCNHKEKGLNRLTVTIFLL